jgi:hypothetical protein
MSRSRKLFRIAFLSLLLPIAAFVGSQLTGGFGPCSSGMAGFYWFYAALLFSGISALLIVIAFAQLIVERIQA